MVRCNFFLIAEHISLCYSSISMKSTDIGFQKIIKNEIQKTIKTEFKPIKSDMGKMRKDIDTMLSLFDREYIDLRQRVERIEEHLNLPSNPSGN